MSTFAFNKLIILESLSPSELQTGTELEYRINEWANCQDVLCRAETFQVHSIQDWENAWTGIYVSIEQKGVIPIIHLEMHGNSTSLGIDGGTKGIISLSEVFKKVQHANVLSQNNIFLSMAVCMGLNVIKSLNVYEPMPFCGVLGSLESLNNYELLDFFTVFYKSFLTTLDLDVSNQAMKNAGIKAEQYMLFKPEQIFLNAYLHYLESYKTDQQIVDKALVAARNAQIAFRDEKERQLFIRDYRCTLLLTENKEYQRAIDAFFIFNRYPNIRNRFAVPLSIYDFKQFAGGKGNNWLLQRRRLSDDDIKSLSIQILYEVDEFCKQNAIQYSLAYGTMIGAVRHRGFIPWDDDIDIMMLRPDYNKFVSMFNHYKPELFSVAAYELDSNFHYPMAKISCNATINDELGYTGCGFAIDLFPIDKLPSSDDELRVVLRQKKRAWNLFSLKTMKWNNKRGFVKNMAISFSKAFINLLPYSYIHNIVKRITDKYETLDGNYFLGCLYTPYGDRDIMTKDVFSETVKMPFEHYEFSCIKEYDKFLSKVYGEYMIYPPIEQQISHHDFVAYWK